MRVGSRSQSEVTEVLLPIARLPQRAQHQEREDSLFRLAGNLAGELLIHARGDVHIFGNLHRLRSVPRTAAMMPVLLVGAAVGVKMHPPHRQHAYTQRISE